MTSYQRWKGIMKCYPFEEKRLAKWQPPYIVQPKFDGDRCRNIPTDTTSLFVTSEENIYYSIPHIQQQALDSGVFRYPLDGELYNHNLFLEGGHDLIHSIASRKVNLHPRHEELDFIVFDIKDRLLSQMERLIKLNDLSKSFPSNIKLAPYWICNSLEEIKAVYDRLVGQKYEGIIVRNLFNMYEDKRSTTVMKFKPKKKDTYTIIGWKEEISIHGEPKGRIGSLGMTSQSGDVFWVSAGLDDSEKDYLWKVRDNIPGHKAIVHYQHLNPRGIPKGSFDIEIPSLGIGSP